MLPIISRSPGIREGLNFILEKDDENITEEIRIELQEFVFKFFLKRIQFHALISKESSIDFAKKTLTGNYNAL